MHLARTRGGTRARAGGLSEDRTIKQIDLFISNNRRLDPLAPADRVDVAVHDIHDLTRIVSCPYLQVVGVHDAAKGHVQQPVRPHLNATRSAANMHDTISQRSTRAGQPQRGPDW